MEAAARYLQELTGVETMTQLRAAIRADLEEQVRIAAEIKDKVSELMDRAERFQHLNRSTPLRSRWRPAPSATGARWPR